MIEGVNGRETLRLTHFGWRDEEIRGKWMKLDEIYRIRQVFQRKWKKR